MMERLCLALFIVFGCELQSSSTSQFFPRMGLREPPEPIAPAENDGPQTQWFDQKLDHFDPSNNKTWKQRYYYNDRYYKPQSEVSDNLPLFVMIGGEAGIQGGWVNGGFWVNVGIPFRALFMFVEHRFYGESHPTDDLSTENLKYLSSRQALADLDYFIGEMKEKFNMTNKNKVVVFGGSYSGALAAWSRLKYPDTIQIAHASSAPIHAKHDFSGYYDICKKSLATWDEKCASTIHEAATKQQELMKTQEGLDSLSKTFNTCRPLKLDHPENIWTFFMNTAASIGHTIQYNSTDGPNIPDNVCKYLTDENEEDAYQRYANYAKRDNSCTGYNFYANVANLKNTSWSGDAAMSGSRQWTWQTCSEFGFFMTSSTDDSLFAGTIALDYWDLQCKAVFGDDFTPKKIEENVAATNKHYGGLDYKQSDVVFTQGSVDPWQAAGITESNEEEGYKAVYIDNASHVQDQDGAKASDPPGLTEARKEIKAILEEWIEQYSCNFQKYVDQVQQQSC